MIVANLLQLADDPIYRLLLRGTEAVTSYPEICAQQEGVGGAQGDPPGGLARQQHRTAPIGDRLTNAEVGLIRWLRVQDLENQPQIGLGDRPVGHPLRDRTVAFDQAQSPEQATRRVGHVSRRSARLVPRHSSSVSPRTCPVHRHRSRTELFK